MDWNELKLKIHTLLIEYVMEQTHAEGTGKIAIEGVLAVLAAEKNHFERLLKNFN